MKRQRILPVTENEFLTLNHRALNDPKLNIESCVDESLDLRNCLNGKKPVPCLEGDLVPVKENGEVVFAHKSRLTKSQYEHLREAGVAVPLNEALDRIAEYRQKNEGQRVSIFFDVKSSVDEKTIAEVLKQLQTRNLTDVIFNSYHGWQLDELYDRGVQFPRSFNLIGRLGGAKLYIPFQMPKRGYDFLIQPITTTYFSETKEPTLYGAVTSEDELKKIAEDPLVLGTCLRLKEGSILKMLYNSLSSKL